MPRNAAWPMGATRKSGSETGPSCTQPVVQTAGATHLPTSQQGQDPCIGAVEFAVRAASSVIVGSIDPIVLAPATGVSTSPMPTKAARIDLRIRMRVTRSSAYAGSSYSMLAPSHINASSLVSHCSIPAVSQTICSSETSVLMPKAVAAHLDLGQTAAPRRKRGSPQGPASPREDQR